MPGVKPKHLGKSEKKDKYMHADPVAGERLKMIALGAQLAA